MGLFEQFPYTNYHEKNLQWLMEHVGEYDDQIKALQDKDVELQQEIDNIDVTPAVDAAIDDLKNSGYFEEIIDEKIDFKTRNLNILRVGRILDAYGYNNASPVLGGQSICYDGGKYYTCGNIGPSQQAIAVWDGTGNLLTSATYSALQHTNSIAAFGNYLYIAAGSMAILSKVNKSTLAFVEAIDLSAIFGAVYGVDEYDGKLYILGDVVGSPDVRKIVVDDGGGTFTDVCTFVLDGPRVNQGFAVRGDYAYAMMGESNTIYKVELSTGNIVFEYFLPDGDGWNPAGEYEDIFKIGDELRIATALYYNYYAHDTIVTPDQQVTIAQIFATDIDGVLQKDVIYEYMQGVSLPQINVNEGYTYSFNPQNNYTTVEEACYVANYLRKGVINVYGLSHGLIRLVGGVYYVNGRSGSRKAYQMDFEEAAVIVSVMSTDDLMLTGAILYMQNADLGRDVDINRSRACFDTVWMSTTVSFYMRRSDVDFREVRGVNGSLAIGLPDGAANNHVHVYSPFVNNLLKLAKLSGAAQAYFQVINNTGRFFNVRVATSYIGGTWAAAVYNESLYNQFEEVSGGAYRARKTDNTYVNMSATDYTIFDA